MDTGANENAMSRRKFVALLDANLDLNYVKGSFGGLEVKLEGGQTLHVASDKVGIETEVATTWAKSEDERSLYIYTYVYRGGTDPNIRILDMITFGIYAKSSRNWGKSRSGRLING